MSANGLFSSAAIACTVLPLAALVSCNNGVGAAGAVPEDAAADAMDASTPAADALVPDGAVEAPAGAEAGDAGDADVGPHTSVRFANFTPDAPSLGYDFCLAPAGTTSWLGPLLAQSLRPGSLGPPGGPNGAQFAAVSEYFPVPPGTYDLQLVVAGTASCATGIIATTTNLPALALDAHVTFASLGDSTPAGGDPGLSVALFRDDSVFSGGQTALRFINAVPSAPTIDVGTGSLANGNYVPLVDDIAFGATSVSQDGGPTTDANGYLMLAPVSGTRFSAHTPGATLDSATATNVTLAAGAVTTMVLINGKTHSVPPQFLLCTDNGAPVLSESACNVFAQ